MRLLLWVLLLTLVTLLASGKGASSELANTATTKNSRIDAFDVRALSAKQNSNDKRSLRAATSTTAELNTEEEERLSLASIPNFLKTALGGAKTGMSSHVSKFHDYATNLLFKRLYNKGATPTKLRARLMGNQAANGFLAKYNAWWKQVQDATEPAHPYLAIQDDELAFYKKINR